MTVLFVVFLVLMVSRIKSKTNQSTESSSVVRDIGRVLQATDIICTPDTSEVQTIVNKTLMYLKFTARPELLFYRSPAVAEEAYLNMTTSANAASRRVVGINFVEIDDPSTVHYSLRFKALDVADTERLFNHECKHHLYFSSVFTVHRIVSAVLATAIPSVCPSVHHTPVLCQNDGTQHDAVCTVR